VNYTAEELNSKGVTEWNNGNYNKAFKYFQKSADYSYAWGMYNLGHCYELGRGCEKSRAMAIHWYKKAANNNNEEAIKALDRLGVDYNPDGGYANNFNSVIINPSNYPNNYNNTRTCYRCKGSGKCEECYGGKCKNCIGDGYYYYNTYGKVTCNASHEGAQRCSQCYGRGYCPTCNGSNKCQVCSGRGELTN
jgi:TPR repeat protein